MSTGMSANEDSKLVVWRELTDSMNIKFTLLINSIVLLDDIYLTCIFFLLSIFDSYMIPTQIVTFSWDSGYFTRFYWISPFATQHIPLNKLFSFAYLQLNISHSINYSLLPTYIIYFKLPFQCGGEFRFSEAVMVHKSYISISSLKCLSKISLPIHPTDAP